jgi:predicted RNase H-like HicB family nuclease
MRYYTGFTGESPCAIWRNGIEYNQNKKGLSMRQVLIYPDETGMWVAECPSLPGCISQGETREQAIANIKEAIEVYVEALEEDGLPVPEENFNVKRQTG